MPSAPPCAMVIFGASGDLAKRKLMPAIYELAREKLLPEKFAVIGFARTEMSDEAFRKDFRESIQKYARSKSLDENIWKKLEPAVYYVSGDEYGSGDAHRKLAARLREADTKHGTGGNRRFSPPPPPHTFHPLPSRPAPGRGGT